MSSTLLRQLNNEIGEVVEKARRSLVQVRSGRYGVGAGTIWHPDGLIVTNAHVATSRCLDVVLPDGTVRPGRILASAPSLDLAALVVDAAALSAIELGESQRLHAGQWVLALGHPSKNRGPPQALDLAALGTV